MQKITGTIGPGIVIAATGVGAGDLIAASVTGARFGTTMLWVVLIGAILKYVINENLARWQLATGMTLLEGWMTRLPRFISIYFIAYLLLWSFIVAGALINATGLAAHSLVPGISLEAWGILHSIMVLALVWYGAYSLVENVMKILIGAMFLVVISCAALLLPTMQALFSGLLVPSLPEGSIVFLLGVIGGVGGSVTVMSYGYWIREKQWTDARQIPLCRTDLFVAYSLTAVFGIAVMIIAAGVQPEVVKGSGMLLAVASHLETSVSPLASTLFLAGFWAAVFSSMIGVWDGIPYLFADFMRQWKGSNEPAEQLSRSKAYRGFLLFLAFPPMLLLLVGKPVWVVIAYSVAGAFFMPFLAGLLLYMNNRRDWVKDLGNGGTTNLLLLAGLGLFAWLLVVAIQRQLA